MEPLAIELRRDARIGRRVAHPELRPQSAPGGVGHLGIGEPKDRGQDPEHGRPVPRVADDRLDLGSFRNRPVGFFLVIEQKLKAFEVEGGRGHGADVASRPRAHAGGK